MNDNSRRAVPVAWEPVDTAAAFFIGAALKAKAADQHENDRRAQPDAEVAQRQRDIERIA